MDLKDGAWNRIEKSSTWVMTVIKLRRYRTLLNVEVFYTRLVAKIKLYYVLGYVSR